MRDPSFVARRVRLAVAREVLAELVPRSQPRVDRGRLGGLAEDFHERIVELLGRQHLDRHPREELRFAGAPATSPAGLLVRAAEYDRPAEELYVETGLHKPLAQEFEQLGMRRRASAVHVVHGIDDAAAEKMPP